MGANYFPSTTIHQFAYSVRYFQSINYEQIDTLEYSKFIIIIHKWDEKQFFTQLGSGSHKIPIWNAPTQREFMNRLAKTLHITDPSGWYDVTWETIRKYGGDQLFSQHQGSFASLLRTVYP